MESAIGALGGEAKRFEMVTGDAERHLELIMANAASRACQLTGAFAREAERLKETSEAANSVLTNLVATLAMPALARQDPDRRKRRPGQAGRRGSGGRSDGGMRKAAAGGGRDVRRSQQIRELLARTIEDVERHLVRLPTVAQGEAQRVRQMVQSETEQMLDLSARTLSTIHARTAQTRARSQAAQAANDPEPEGDGLKGLARKLTQRPKRGADLRGSGDKTWEMKTLLAAVESSEPAPRELAGGTAAAIGALQMALADMAVDLEAIDARSATPGNEEWKRYLAGDRAVFARKLARRHRRRGGRPHHHALSRRCAVPRRGRCLSERIREPAGARPRRRWRRIAHLVDPLGGYRQDLSGHRLCAWAAYSRLEAARHRSRPCRLIGQMAGQGAQIALGRDPFAVTENLVRHDRRAGEFGMGGQERRDLLLALFALQRTDREDQQSARLATMAAALSRSS